MSQAGTPTVAALLDILRDKGAFARLLATYQLTEDDVIDQVRPISRWIMVALESRAG